MAVTGIVHQHIDGAELLLGLRHGAGNGGEVGHIEHQRMGLAGVERGKGLGILGAAHGADHAVSGLQRGLSEGPAQSRTDAGDQEGLGMTCGHDLTPEGHINYIMI
jgi:hypothetical protein